MAALDSNGDVSLRRSDANANAARSAEFYGVHTNRNGRRSAKKPSDSISRRCQVSALPRIHGSAPSSITVARVPSIESRILNHRKIVRWRQGDQAEAVGQEYAAESSASDQPRNAPLKFVPIGR